MFSENEKISARQLYRAIVVTMVGPTLLVCPRVVAKYGSDGIWVYALAGLLSVLYVGVMLYLSKCFADKKGFAKGFLCGSKCVAGKAFFYVLMAGKLFIMAIIGLYLICDVVTGVLLPGTHILTILAVLLLALIYWNQGSIESSARAFEVLFYWVLVPVFIVIGIAMPKVELPNLTPQMENDFREIFKSSLFLWFLFTPAELLILCGRHFKQDGKSRAGVWKGVTVLFILNAVAYGTILGVYGGSGIDKGSPYPLLKVMQIGGVPGDFLRRVDGFMTVFLVLSLFCEIVLLMDYMGISVRQIMSFLFGYKNKKKLSKEWNRSKQKIIFSSVVAVLLAISVVILRETLMLEHPATTDASVYEDKKIISSVELEERAFVMSVIIGEETVTFEIASDDKDEWQDESVYVTLNSGIVEEAEIMYKDNAIKTLDFSHMKMIFVEEKIYKNRKTFFNLKYMYEQERFAENIIVCPLEGELSNMAAKAMEEEKALAANIEKILKNSGKADGMELYRLFKK